ncbi:ABC transporter permease [Leisingera daeponensis]|uniref:ABC transporter permease n=1 Tax=Leisingera daeponensis TaxID=405746 RepID=A0ABS7NCB2_9RHOB|nr:ABC transporter permease [Leisingera daeponensis]MBY6138506.1 ABC transporter permease [Leisingera daeponensis]
MTLLESLRIALRALRANLLRSFLTMLGIIVGVTSVVAMVAFAEGAQREISRQIKTLGANVLMIVPELNRGGDDNTNLYQSAILRESDAAAIGANIAQVVAAAPSVREDLQVINRNKNTWVTVNGTTSSYFTIREWPLSRGRMFSGQEQLSSGKVALLGQATADKLFGESDPVGQTIRIQSVPFEVIGILAEKGASGSGREQDDIVFIPIASAQKRLFGSANQVHRGSVDYILAKASSPQTVFRAEQEIIRLLRQRHRIRESRDNDFRVVDPAALMAAQHAASRTIGWLLAGIAGVSLIVGGISIMNIMLVSVTERTREIGLRVAVGARTRDVQFQFLMEAVLLCFLGGLIGLSTGAGLAYAASRIAGWPVHLSPLSLIGAVGLASVVGVIFGFFPARRASHLDPVTALRME